MKILSVDKKTNFYGNISYKINIFGIKIRFSQYSISKFLNFRYKISKIIKKFKGKDTGLIYYLSKYKYIIDLADKELAKCNNIADKSDGHIWTMWLQGDSTPPRKNYSGLFKYY